MQHIRRDIESEGGVTLIELLVTLAIFSFVTLVLTTSLLTMLASRDQTQATQRINDEFRSMIDTLEIEITSGTGFDNSSFCDGAGQCSGMSFTVRTRPDIQSYQVYYRLQGDQIEKAIKRNDGICQFTPLPADCWFPVTSDDTSISLLNFSVSASGGFGKPVVSVAIEGEGTTEAGDTVFLTRTITHTPRSDSSLSEVTTAQEVDTNDPTLQLQFIRPTNPGSGCKIYTNVAMTQEFDNTQNFTNDFIPGPLYTTCERIDVGFSAQDGESGLLGARYDMDWAVDCPDCDHSINSCTNWCMPYDGSCPCSADPRNQTTKTMGYFMQSPYFQGSSYAEFVYTNIPLRPGIGRPNADVPGGTAQKIELRVQDISGRLNAGGDSALIIYQMGNIVPVTNEGMVSRVRLYCRTLGDPRIQFMVAPNSRSNLWRFNVPSMYQRHIRVYRCISPSVDQPCNPFQSPNTSYMLEMRHYHGWETASGRMDWRAPEMPSSISLPDWYRRDDGSTRRYWFDWFERFRDSRLSRGIIYTYGYKVYDPFNPSRESDGTLFVWDNGFNSALSTQSSPMTTYMGMSDTSSSLLRVDPIAGRHAGVPTMGMIPADWCLAPEIVDDGGDGGGDGDSEPTTYSLNVSVSGYWEATVTGNPSGSANTNNISFSISGSASNISASYVSISPSVSGTIKLRGPSPTSPGTRSYYLTIPDNTPASSSGTKYTVSVGFSAPDAPTVTRNVTLYVRTNQAGPQ